MGSTVKEGRKPCVIVYLLKYTPTGKETRRTQIEKREGNNKEPTDLEIGRPQWSIGNNVTKSFWCHK